MSGSVPGSSPVSSGQCALHPSPGLAMASVASYDTESSILMYDDFRSPQVRWRRPITEATGYAMDVHDDFWQATPLDRRTALIAEFTGQAQEAKAVTERVKQARQGQEEETTDLQMAMATLPGYELFAWVTWDWAGSRWVHNSEGIPLAAVDLC